MGETIDHKRASQWTDKGTYKEPKDSDNVRVPRLEVDDATTYVDKDGSDNMTLTDAVTGTKTLAQLAAGDVAGPASSTDNAVPCFDGVTGKTLQNTGVLINPSNNNVQGINNLNLIGNIGLGGLVDTRDVAADGTKLDGIESGTTALAEVRLTPQTSSSGPEGTVYYDSDDDHLYVGTE